MVNREIYNIFPTTIYVSEVENHSKYKKEFYKLYSKYDYNQNHFEIMMSGLIRQVKMQVIPLYI